MPVVNSSPLGEARVGPATSRERHERVEPPTVSAAAWLSRSDPRAGAQYMADHHAQVRPCHCRGAKTAAPQMRLRMRSVIDLRACRCHRSPGGRFAPGPVANTE